LQHQQRQPPTPHQPQLQLQQQQQQAAAEEEEEEEAVQRLPAHIHRYDPPIEGIEIIYQALPRPTSPYDSSWMEDSDTMLVHAALLAGADTRPVFSST
jgi:hypothetical protein